MNRPMNRKGAFLFRKLRSAARLYSLGRPPARKGSGNGA
jgi:hypothetical protein